MPKYLAPVPPVTVPESYPTIPPSNIKPANTIGFKGVGPFANFFSYISRVFLTSCLSLTRLSKPTLSTTSNQVQAPTSCNAFITHTSAPCVTALLSNAVPLLCFLCPVLSVKL